jgi:multiple sugar transport system substrate-binding protein
LPNFQEALGTGWSAASFIMMVSKSGKHKDAAFQAASVVASDEVQAELSKDGKLSVLTSTDIQRQYATNLPMFKGKNIDGIFKAAPRKINVPNTEYDVVVRSAIDDSAKELAAGKDINTLLRETEEKANQAIEASRKK